MPMTAREVGNGYSVGGPRRWLIEGISGSKIVGDARDVRDLLDQGRVGAHARVYEIASEPRTLGEIPELAKVLGPDAISDLPVRDHRRSAEWERLSEELAILDHPLREEEIEYFDPAPSRGKRLGRILLFVVMAAGAVGAGGFVARSKLPSLSVLRAARVGESAPAAAPAVHPAQEALRAAPSPSTRAEEPAPQIKPVEPDSDHHPRRQRAHAGSTSKRAHRR